MEFSNEHGRITIYILVIIFFAMIVIMSKYLIVSNELEKERGLLDEIKKEYAVQNPEEKPEEKTDEKEPERDVFDGYEVKTDDIPVYNSDAFLFFSKYFFYNINFLIELQPIICILQIICYVATYGHNYLCNRWSAS